MLGWVPGECQIPNTCGVFDHECLVDGSGSCPGSWKSDFIENTLRYTPVSRWHIGFSERVFRKLY